MKSRPVGSGMPALPSQIDSSRDDARASGFLLAHQQLGVIALGTEPADGDTYTFDINGTNVVATAKTTLGSTANQVKIGGSALAFATNLLGWLRRPDITTSTAVAASSANQALLQYVGWAWPGSSTNIVPFSLNKNVNGLTGALTSFSASTTTSGNSWTAATLKLYVEDGTYYINGTRYLFTGNSTPVVTAPVTYPRIDVLTIDTSGTLAWTTGTENASPSAPTYPANKLAICELYNVVSETALYDNENQQSGQGYISNDVRPAMSAGPIFGAIPEDLAPAATDTYNIGESGSNEWLAVYAENIYAKNYYLNGILTAFKTDAWGDGSDGTVTISSGTTTLTRDMYYSNLTVQSGGILITAGYRIFVLNTLTVNSGGLIHNNGGNASGSTGGTGGAGGNLVAGANGGNGGNGGGAQTGNSAGNAGTQPSTAAVTKPVGNATGVAGGGGGSGASNNYSGGSGGGGGLAGAASGTAINFPRSLFTAFGLLDGSTQLGASVISGAGGGGGSGGGNTGGAGGPGGGAGGNGGFVWIAAFSLVNNGTIESLGGNGGNGGNGGSSNGAGGGAGSGGSGGVIVYIYSAFSGNAPVVTGGTAGSVGTGSGTGGSGSAGSTGATGKLYALQTL